MARWQVWLVLLMTAGCAHEAAQQATPVAPVPAVHALPKDTLPDRLVLASDGAVWVAEEYGGLVRLGPDGKVRETLPEPDEELGLFTDLAAGPDGTLRAVLDGAPTQVSSSGR